MRIAKIGVIALFLFMALGGIGGVMLAGYTFICVLSERLHQPFKQAVCDDRRQCTSNRSSDHIRGIKSAKSDDDGRYPACWPLPLRRSSPYQC